jgi:hypothetical protein
MRHKRWLMLLACIGAVLSIALGAAATVVVMRLAERGAAETTGTTPRDGADLETRINRVVADQTAALLRKDEKGFLRPAKDPAVRDKLQLRYRNLIALKVTKFTMAVRYLSISPAPDRWQAEVVISFCFVLPDCVADKVSEPTLWADKRDGPELVSLEPAVKPTAGWFGDPQPWEMTKLEVAHRGRVLVAAPEGLAHRLPDLLEAAHAAVPVADSFSIGPPPDLYRVYLADAESWKTWYGSNPPHWSAGYANPIGATHSDLVLNNEHDRASKLGRLLRHEMTHASTAQGSHQWVGNWWLMEGIAEVAGYAGETAADDDLRRFIRNGWDRKLDADGPSADASTTEAGRAYGIAFLAVKRLDTRFGRAKLLIFFERVVEFGEPYDKASMTAFGLPWAGVEADCLAAIKDA